MVTVHWRKGAALGDGDDVGVVKLRDFRWSFYSFTFSIESE